MKSSKLVKNTNLKRVGILSLMVLSLSVGMVSRADEVDKSFKLWHDVVGTEEKPKAVLHMEKETDKLDSVKWLVNDSTDANVKKFVEANAKEPFKFVEGLKEARVAAERANKFDKKFSDDLLKKLAKIDEDSFGGKDAKEAFLALVKKVMKSDFKFDKDWLKKLFNKRSLLQALDLTDKDPNVSPSPSPSPSPSASPSPSPSASPKPSATATPSPTRIPDGPRTGEQFDDAALQRQAQQICDKMNGQNQDQLKALKDQFNTLKGALEDQLDEVAKASQAVQPNNNARQKERGLEEILPGLLANAVGKDDQQEITPANNSQQPFPQQQQRREQTDPNLNQPLPDQGQVPQQPNIPQYQPVNNNFGPVRLDLPSMTGRQELRDAQDVLSEIQMRQPVATTLGPNAGLPELVMAKAKVASLSRKAQGALIAGEDRLSRLDEQLEELKEGGRAALPESAKRKVSELERAVQEAKNQAQYQQQVVGMLAPEQKQMAMGEVMAAQQKVQQAEGALNQYKSEVDMAIESGNAKIKALAKVRDNLQSTVSKLKSEVGGLKEEEASVQTLINTNMQMQLQQMQPQQAGVSNVNRLGGFSGGAGNQPRTQAPRIGNSLQTTPTRAASGDVRGSLAGGKK